MSPFKPTLCKYAQRSVHSLALEGVKLNLYQVEPLSYCNGGCSYCPQPKLRRAQGYMSEQTLEAVFAVARNRSFHLHGFCEPLIRGDIVQVVRRCTDAGFRVGFSTNGFILDQRLLEELVGAGLAWLRLHVGPFGVRRDHFTVPEGLLMTEHRVGKVGPDEVSEKVMTSFAGRVPGVRERGGFRRCSFLGYPEGKTWQCVFWDGTIYMCCQDAHGEITAENACEHCARCGGFVFRGPEDWGNYDGDGWTKGEKLVGAAGTGRQLQ